MSINRINIILTHKHTIDNLSTRQIGNRTKAYTKGDYSGNKYLH